MNERIKELKDKIWTEEYWDTPNTDKLLPFQLNRFAELIVKECVIRAEREWIRNGSDTEHNQAVSKVIESIKDHFGVEK
jgi:hypothetical protein